MSMLELLERAHGKLDEARLRLILLTLLKSPFALARVLNRHGSAREALDGEELTGMPPVDKVLSMAEAEFSLLERHGVTLLIPDSAGWPTQLGTSIRPPPLLLVQGVVDVLRRSPVLALVGSRRNVDYGKRLAGKMAALWAGKGGLVVSGGAQGVDTAAHAGALEGGGATVAVLGSGLCIPYPSSNASLFERIRMTGALVSELPMRAEPFPSNFPERNRIIAGLANCVIVVQAGRGSGALHTAKFALKSGRCLYTVPGPVEDEAFYGGLELLAMGVPPLIDVGQLVPLFEGSSRGETDIKTELPLRVSTRPTVDLSCLTEMERSILVRLSQGEMHVDDLAEGVDTPSATLTLSLLRMGLKGWVERRAGNRYSALVKLKG